MAQSSRDARANDHSVLPRLAHDFLPRTRYGAPLSLPWSGHETVKHMVEATRVPHQDAHGKMCPKAETTYRGIIDNE